MSQKKYWPKILAVVLFMMLLGGYYDRLSVETRTFILPLGIIVPAAFVFTRLKQLEYETRAAKLVAQELSLVDGSGNERVSFSAVSEDSLMTIYDENHLSRATLELLNGEPILKLTGEKGSVVLSFNGEGLPSVAIRGEADEIIWSAP